MATARAPKQWLLSKDETINTFENWRKNLPYILSLDNNFAAFLHEGFTWGNETTLKPNRDLVDDSESVPELSRKKTQLKRTISSN